MFWKIIEALDIPVYRNQMQKDLSSWIEYGRFKIQRRKIWKVSDG